MIKKGDQQDIWIGESVRIKSSGREGRFEGLNSDGKARVSSLGKFFLTTISNLEVLPPKDHKPSIEDILNDSQETIKKNIKIKFDHTLDLHIEKLAPHLLNQMPPYILEYQIQKSKEFIENAIHYNYPHVTIIHGKGQGVLKTAIENLLRSYPHVKFTFSKNDGGAVEVWM